MYRVTESTQLRELLPARPRGFVPTMGALHDGHLALVRASKERCSSTVVSIFVNPMQFAPHEDLSRYPRDIVSDCEKLEAAGVDIVFLPRVEEIYPPEFSTTVDVGALGHVFEGAARPTHFRGVTTVVAKLLNLVQPDLLFLGQKDAQQTAVVQAMMRDLSIATQIAIVPTMRESDGLAMSSRNVYLDAAQRRQAVTLAKAIGALRDALAAGQPKCDALAFAARVLAPQATLEYLDVVDATTFIPLDALRPPYFVVGAARFGETRLLDNVMCLT